MQASEAPTNEVQLDLLEVDEQSPNLSRANTCEDASGRPREACLREKSACSGAANAFGTEPTSVPPAFKTRLALLADDVVRVADVLEQLARDHGVEGSIVKRHPFLGAPRKPVVMPRFAATASAPRSTSKPVDVVALEEVPT